MTSISFQFHATREELLPLLRDLIGRSGLVVTAIGGVPPAMTLLQDAEATLRQYEGQPLSFAITVGPPNGQATNMYAFTQQNPNSFAIELGRVTPKGLTESWLALRADHRRLVAEAKRVKRQLFALTARGARAQDPSTGAAAMLPNHRYTRGARELYEAGVAILPVAGNTVLHLA